MPAELATGLILRTRPLTDTSLVVHWLTSEHGRLATVAKGARRPKSPFHGKLDLFYQADFSYQRSRRSELHNLREVVLRDTHAALREDFGRLRQAAYGALLVEQVTETDTPVPGIHRMFSDLVQGLCRQPPQTANMLAFELQLLEELGLAPDPGKSRLSDGARHGLSLLSAADLAAVPANLLAPATAGEVARFLERFLLDHLGRVPRGRDEGIAICQTRP